MEVSGETLEGGTSKYIQQGAEYSQIIIYLSCLVVNLWGPVMSPESVSLYVHKVALSVLF